MDSGTDCFYLDTFATGEAQLNRDLHIWQLFRSIRDTLNSQRCNIAVTHSLVALSLSTDVLLMTDFFYPLLLVLARRGAAPVKISTGGMIIS